MYYRESSVLTVGNEELRVILRKMSSDVRNEISKYKSARWASFLSTIQLSHDKKEKALWSHLGKIYRAKALPFSKLSVGTRIISDEQDIVDELFKYFKDQSNAPEIDPANPHEVHIKAEYTSLKNLLDRTEVTELERTSTKEVTRIIKKMKGKKSSGKDQVSNQMIKLLPPTYIECLVSCFNGWLKQCRYPAFWKAAKIVTLNKLKAGVPRCEQTRPISLLATHSKIFEKIILDKVRQWAAGNSLVPQEQSGFRNKCLLQTRVLSILQEIKNNLAANAPTLAIYVDYEKAYDRVWHVGLLVKLHRLDIPLNLIRMIMSWLENREAYLIFGNKESMTFGVNIGLPQGSSLSPFLFVVYHWDLVKCLGAHAGHLFADDLCGIIRAPLTRLHASLIRYLEEEGTKFCGRIAQYSFDWKQPINVPKTVGQIFRSQIKRPLVNITMQGHKIDIVNSFKYLGFSWTSKLSLMPTVQKGLENIQRSLNKLRWLRSGKTMSKEVLRKCFLAYTFPHFAWVFPVFPFLPETQKDALRRKFRVAIRLIHRAAFVDATHLFAYTQENSLDSYVKRYISKRLNSVYESDLGSSLFLEDIFHWDNFRKREKDGGGHFFSMKRVKRMKDKHRSLLLSWLDFVE